MKRIKLFYAILITMSLIVASLLWFNAHWKIGYASQLDQIKARGVLRVATLNAAPSYFIERGQASGIDYELASLFADYLGVKLIIEPKSDIESLFSSLEKRNTDLAAAALIYNPERMKKFRVSPAYYSVSQQLVYRQGTPRPKNFDMVTSDLIVPEGSAHLAALNLLKQKKHPDLKWHTLPNLTDKDLLRKVADGSITYTIADSVTISSIQRVYPQLAIAFDISEEEPIMWYLTQNSDNSLYVAMLDFFNMINEDSTLARIEEKYLGHIGGFNYVDARTFVKAIDKVLPEYETLFRKYASNEVDWRLLAAISYQESHWNPQATSSTGVRGLMMLTRPTAQTFGVTDRLDPEQSIRGGVEFIDSLLQRLPADIPDDEKIWFALTAYNMGYSHMLDAQLLTEIQGANPNRWADVKQRLPMLTQKQHYTQTKYGYARGYQAFHYIENIRRYHKSLVEFLSEKESTEHQKQKELDAKLALLNAYPAIAPETALKRL